MALIANRKTKVGDVVMHEYAATTGYCRDRATTVVVAGMAVGALLKYNGTTFKFEWAAKADAANVVAVLIDDRIYDLAVGDQQLVHFNRGPAQVGETFLTFSNGGVADVTEFKAAVTALGARGIEVVAQI